MSYAPKIRPWSANLPPDRENGQQEIAVSDQRSMKSDPTNNAAPSLIKKVPPKLRVEDRTAEMPLDLAMDPTQGHF
ncbi:hypothetical protein [Hyphomicrobium sp. ghe19]|uniref:hypothetical protein n=1 Tax=Hyphomicrobium sp. ghe19 TaxID=2682968 RepID=UPI0013668143|nr:hypothetical protein HYPP_04020 [Hyphomicrobium sp. ghe19]